MWATAPWAGVVQLLTESVSRSASKAREKTLGVVKGRSLTPSDERFQDLGAWLFFWTVTSPAVMTLSLEGYEVATRKVSAADAPNVQVALERRPVNGSKTPGKKPPVPGIKTGR